MTRAGDMRDESRQAAEGRGRTAEWKALALLVSKGYRPLARRWRCAAGELDLVVCRSRTLAFVEVKARADPDAAQAAITPRQQRRMATAAQVWLARNPAFAGYNMRFDAVFVVPRRLPRHLPDAFRP
ncbi:MAG: YraN family protein [Rhodobiaceae bacterium]|nr:YraN family protein [Rhodobiaceae bacterium]MCC0016008.1 YraN family protein [Rhodobiaceae bacterium]MCC0042306.1 YraN family protein [Rhodobiaceae bacterium]